MRVNGVLTNGALALAPAARAVIEAACARERLREACGALIGTVRADAAPLAFEVVDAVELANVARGADEFAIDPAAIVALAADARSRGLAVSGFWHTHPSGPALPSARDRAEAWPGHVTLVAAPADIGGARLRAFWPVERSFAELAIVSTESAPRGRLR